MQSNTIGGGLLSLRVARLSRPLPRMVPLRIGHLQTLPLKSKF
jgi:hypothetical protein